MLDNGKHHCDECGEILERGSVFAGKIVCGGCRKRLRELIAGQYDFERMWRASRYSKMAGLLIPVFLFFGWATIIIAPIVFLITHKAQALLLALGAVGPFATAVLLVAAQEVFRIARAPQNMP